MGNFNGLKIGKKHYYKALIRIIYVNENHTGEKLNQKNTALQKYLGY